MITLDQNLSIRIHVPEVKQMTLEQKHSLFEYTDRVAKAAAEAWLQDEGFRDAT